MVKRELSLTVKLSIYVPALTFGHDLWVETRKNEVMDTRVEMSFLHKVSGP